MTGSPRPAPGLRRGRLWFGTRSSKSRLNFLGMLRAGHTDFVLNDTAFSYMRNPRTARHPDRPTGRSAGNGVYRSGCLVCTS